MASKGVETNARNGAPQFEDLPPAGVNAVNGNNKPEFTVAVPPRDNAFNPPPNPSETGSYIHPPGGANIPDPVTGISQASQAYAWGTCPVKLGSVVGSFLIGFLDTFESGAGSVQGYAFYMLGAAVGTTAGTWCNPAAISYIVSNSLAFPNNFGNPIDGPQPGSLSSIYNNTFFLGDVTGATPYGDTTCGGTIVPRTAAGNQGIQYQCFGTDSLYSLNAFNDGTNPFNDTALFAGQICCNANGSFGYLACNGGSPVGQPAGYAAGQWYLSPAVGSSGSGSTGYTNSGTTGTVFNFYAVPLTNNLDASTGDVGSKLLIAKATYSGGGTPSAFDGNGVPLNVKWEYPSGQMFNSKRFFSAVSGVFPNFVIMAEATDVNADLSGLSWTTYKTTVGGVPYPWFGGAGPFEGDVDQTGTGIPSVSNWSALQNGTVTDETTPPFTNVIPAPTPGFVNFKCTIPNGTIWPSGTSAGDYEGLASASLTITQIIG